MIVPVRYLWNSLSKNTKSTSHPNYIMKSGSLCLIQAVASIVVLVIISMIVIVSIDLLPVFTTR